MVYHAYSDLGCRRKTYYEQWIREEEGEWIRTGLLSYPSIGPRFSGTSMFQEDFTYNNASRSCRIRNAYDATTELHLGIMGYVPRVKHILCNASI